MSDGVSVSSVYLLFENSVFPSRKDRRPFYSAAHCREFVVLLTLLRIVKAKTKLFLFVSFLYIEQ